MHVFVTGANGYIGSAIVKELLSHGHEVLGLVRSESSGNDLEATGAKSWMGSLDDLDSLINGAAQCDAVIHTAFSHDFSRFMENCKRDFDVIGALAKGLLQRGPGLPLVITSATSLNRPGVVGYEHDPPIEAPRKLSEDAAHAAAAQGVRAIVIRLPPVVYGHGDKAFIPELVEIARKTGQAAYVGDGSNVWPAAHRDDVTVLYRLALEKGSHAATYHGTAGEGFSIKSLATTIGKHLSLPVVSKSIGDAPAHFGFLAMFIAIHSPVSSVQTQKELGWTPKHLSLIEVLDDPNYKYFAQ